MIITQRQYSVSDDTIFNKAVGNGLLTRAVPLIGGFLRSVCV